MTDTPIVTFTVSLPTSTHARLRAYAEIANSPINNALSYLINKAIDDTVDRYPAFAGLRRPSLMRPGEYSDD